MKLPRFASAAIRKLRGDHRTAVLQTIPKNAVCVEIGVWKGDFSKRIRATERLHALHLIDPWRFVPSYPQRWYGGSAARNQNDMDRIYQDVVHRFANDPCVHIHRLDSASAALRFDDAVLDWVYLDADHSYHTVLTDLEAWTPKIKPGGMLAGDDYTWQDEEGTHSVKRAVQDFIDQQSPREISVVGDQFLIRF